MGVGLELSPTSCLLSASSLLPLPRVHASIPSLPGRTVSPKIKMKGLYFLSIFWSDI